MVPSFTERFHYRAPPWGGHARDGFSRAGCWREDSGRMEIRRAGDELYLYVVPATNLLLAGEPNESHDGALWWW